MYGELKKTFYRLLTHTELGTFRYLFHHFNVEKNRLTGLVGPRGVGKTTLMLQAIKEKNQAKESLYFSADNILFAKKSIIELVEYAYEYEAIRYFYVDEAHKYKNWNQELKNIYDSFPDIHLVFSGSSSLDLVKGTYDLSRRAVMLRLHGMSFREYLNFSLGTNFKTVPLRKLFEDPDSMVDALSNIPNILKLFSEYLRQGYYPFVFENEESFQQKLHNMTEKTIFEDIQNFYDLKTRNITAFKKILVFLASIPPSTVNINKLANYVGLDNKTIQTYIKIMEETSLIKSLHINKSGAKLVRTPEKYYLDNATMYSAINLQLGREVNTGVLREIFFINACENAGHSVYFSDKQADFEVEGVSVEVGGKNKDFSQIADLGKFGRLAKDGLLIPSKREIPLHYFGFLY